MPGASTRRLTPISSPASEPGPPRGRRPPWLAIARWAVLAASVALLGRMLAAGWPDVREAFAVLLTRQAPVILAVLAIEAVWTYTLAQGARSAVLAVGGTVGRRDALRISMGGYTLSRVVPVGGVAGGVFAARELVRLGNAPPVALAGMAVSWFVATGTLAALIASATSAAALTGRLPYQALVPSVLVLSLVVAAAVLAVRALGSAALRARLTGFADAALRRLGAGGARGTAAGGKGGGAGTAAGLSEPLDAVAANLRAPRRLLPALAWSAASWTLDMAALWLVFLAFGHELSVTELAIGYGFANLLSALPEVTPGWVGVFEAAVATTYIGLGAPGGVAVVAVLAYRLVSFWLPVVAGILPAVRSLAAGSAGEAARPAPPPQVPLEPSVGARLARVPAVPVLARERVVDEVAS